MADTSVIESEVDAEPFDTARVYLLGYYNKAGKACLTTWDGDLPIIHVIVDAPTEYTMSFCMWGEHKKQRVQLMKYDPAIHTLEVITAHPTWYRAFGWYLPKRND